MEIPCTITETKKDQFKRFFAKSKFFTPMQYNVIAKNLNLNTFGCVSMYNCFLRMPDMLKEEVRTGALNIGRITIDQLRAYEKELTATYLNRKTA